MLNTSVDLWRVASVLAVGREVSGLISRRQRSLRHN